MNRYVFFILVVVLGACTDHDLLFNQYEPESNVFFDVTNNCRVSGQMLSSSSAILSLGYKVVYTEDDFETLQYVAYNTSFCDKPPPLYMDGYNYWWFERGQLYYTDPLMTNTETLRFSDLQPIPESLKQYSIPTRKPIFEDENHFYFIHRAHYAICKADAIAKTYTIEEQLPIIIDRIWYGPYSIFRVKDQFLVLVYDHSSSVWSDEGGRAYDHYILKLDEFSEWQPYYLFTGQSESLTEIEGLKNLMYAKVGDEYYLSSDGAETWTLVENNVGSKILDMEIIDSQTIYAVTGNRLEEIRLTTSQFIKSFDAGKSWSTMPDKLYADEISFFDQDNGIAMSGYILQSTDDGGETWKLVWND